MRSKISFPLLALVLTCATAAPASSRAQIQREIATKPSKLKYLFFLGDEYELHLNVPEKNVATDVLMQVQAFDVKRKFTQKGTFSFPDMKLACGGIIYTVPAHKVVVLEKRPEGTGFHIDTVPDPNGSGNVELLITYHADPDRETLWMCNLKDRPKGIEDVDASGGRNGTAGKLDVILRNTTDAPYTVTREFFQNLPPVKDWPEIVIPPAGSK